MLGRMFFASLLASTALVAATTPVQAGQDERARQAIAAAEAKLQTATTLGTGLSAPYDTAEARAALATAKEKLARGREKAAIDAALQAQSMADAAVIEMQRRKDAELASANAAAREGVAAAQGETAIARDRAAAAQVEAGVAQQQAASAEARANAAELSAAVSAVDAAAARNAAADAMNKPTQVETTVTTQQPAAARRSTTTTTVKKKPAAISSTTVRTTPAPAPAQVTTTTKVTQ